MHTQDLRRKQELVATTEIEHQKFDLYEQQVRTSSHETQKKEVKNERIWRWYTQFAT